MSCREVFLVHAIHLVCRKTGGAFNGLAWNDASGVFCSGSWDVPEAQAQALVCGWLYLHPEKRLPSEFGGIITGFETVHVPGTARPDRIIFWVDRREGGVGQAWRGVCHKRAFCSGLVTAQYAHEREQERVLF
jgi:hypothetical protein